MAIGDLYNAANVVTGQAAVFVSPVNTPLIDLSKFNLADPFDPTAWNNYQISVAGTTAFTLTFTRRGTTAATASQTVTGLTAAALQTALANLANVGVGNVAVTGTTTTGPFFVAFDEALLDGVLSVSASTGTAPVFTGPLWQPVGATEQGWQLGTDKSTQAINIEEQSTPVGTTLTSQTVSLQGSLSEDISRTLAVALNATVAKVAPTTLVGGYDALTLTDIPLTYAVGMVTTNAEGFGRIIYAPAWTSLSNVSASFRRAAGQRLYGVTFSTVCATNLIQIINFTANHS
jgi:hypothetical protein